jgi:hypothetical protein
LDCSRSGTTLANADPATYDYTGPHFTQCDFGPCPANYASDYLIASFTLSNPPVPDLDASQNELPFVTKWSISDKLGYLALSSSDPQAATELALLTFGTSGPSAASLRQRLKDPCRMGGQIAGRALVSLAMEY